VSSSAERPTLRLEKRLLRDGASLVAGVDEVGRGAPGGPVCVGVVTVDSSVRRPLDGVRDSKLLGATARETLVPRIVRWAVGHAVGHASAAEVDEFGIIGALRTAAHRAIDSLERRPDVVVLDGSHDWLSPVSQPSLFTVSIDTASIDTASIDTASIDTAPPMRVLTLVKADMRCASVAAASVIAKVERDGVMTALDTAHPGYGWSGNKGYGSPSHLDAIRRLGPCVHHRRSWNLPTGPV
jgi:ribonuclease HII